VNFSDSPRHTEFIPAMLVYLSERLGLPELTQLAKEQPPYHARGELAWRMRALITDLPKPDNTVAQPALHDWYNGMMWMIAREDPANPQALVLAAKGGHNDEMHNHNDVGNFIVHVRQESLIADIGCGLYTLQYFGPQRYDFLTTSSIGHSLPVANNQPQCAGHAHAAHLIEHSHSQAADVLHLDLKDAYPTEAGLSLLERRLILHRDSPKAWVELVDRFAFAQEAAPFHTAITTFTHVECGENAVILCGEHGKLRIGYDPEIIQVSVERYHDVPFSDGQMDINRIAFAPITAQQNGEIRLEIVPV